MKQLLSYSAIVSCLVLATFGCSDNTEQTAATTPSVKLVKTFTLAQSESGAYRDFPAVVEASEEATLAFRVSGQLSALEVTSGQLVEKGELIAALDPTDYQIAVDQAQANYDLAKLQFERNKTLLEKQLTSKSGFDELNAQLSVAAAALKSATTNLAYTELHAPFSGQIAQRFVENYESVTAQQAVFSLQKNDVVDIAIQVPEDLFSNVDKENQYEPEITFDTHPNQQFRARLKEYDTDADAATNTYRVVLEMDRPDSFNVYPGMSATVRAQLDQIMKVKPGGWKIPSAAIFNESKAGEQLSYVFVVNSKNQLEKRLVEIIGINDKGFTVNSGLRAGEVIVAAGVHLLTSGETIRIWQKERGL